MLEGDKDDGFCHAANKWLDDEWFCWFQYPEGDIATDKPLNCPLVPLPAGHGKLIDGDSIVAALKKQVTERDKIMELCKRVGDMENYFRCSNNQTEIVSFVRMLNNAPAIVPAEGGTDNDKR
jgi:hypothetical protein